MIYDYYNSKPDLTELYHHGILGMRWGKRNGPPYPLDAEDHSKSEKNAGWKKSLSGSGKESNKKSTKKPTNEKKTPEEKFTKEQVDAHRKKMLKEYSKVPEIRKAYEEASDDAIREDLQHRENVKKALVIGAAAVGIGVAAYAIYSRKTLHDFQIAKDALKSGDIDTLNLDALAKKGLTIDTANKLISLDAKHKTIDDAEIFEIVKSGVLKDMDLSISNARIKRMDFRPDFDISKAKDPLFAAIGEKDAESYRRNFVWGLIKNRSGAGKDSEVYQVTLQATKELKIPSRENSKKIYEQLMTLDPDFDDDLRAAVGDMAAKNNPYFKAMYPNGISDMMWEALKQGEFNAGRKGADYLPNAIMGASGIAKEKVSKAFKDAGYNTIVDIHDVMDRVSDLPIIVLDNSILEVVEKTKHRVM